jgi:hypothetical protein
MDSQLQTNRFDNVLLPVLRRHPGFLLERSGQGQAVWFARITRDRQHEAECMEDQEVDLRDALYASNLQLRSTTTCRDWLELQVSAPDQY